MIETTRRAWLMSALGGSVALAQQRPFPGVAYRNYPAMLPDFLRRLASEARGKRDAALAKIVDVASVRARQAWTQRTLLELIGGLPEKSDLNARTAGSFERQGYRVE